MNDLVSLIEKHDSLLAYELGNYDRATRVGSHDAASAALERAGHHASIVTALRGQRRDK